MSQGLLFAIMQRMGGFDDGVLAQMFGAPGEDSSEEGNEDEDESGSAVAGEADQGGSAAARGSEDATA